MDFSANAVLAGTTRITLISGICRNKTVQFSFGAPSAALRGHDCGEVASRTVAEHICGYWEKNPKRPDSEKKVIDACQETKIAFDNKSRVEMGTTMALVAIEHNKAILAHCGGSRI